MIKLQQKFYKEITNSANILFSMKYVIFDKIQIPFKIYKIWNIFLIWQMKKTSSFQFRYRNCSYFFSTQKCIYIWIFVMIFFLCSFYFLRSKIISVEKDNSRAINPISHIYIYICILFMIFFLMVVLFSQIKNYFSRQR